jgi:hypothetical protein
MAAQEAAAAFSVEVGRRPELDGKYALLLPRGVDGRFAPMEERGRERRKRSGGISKAG